MVTIHNNDLPFLIYRPTSESAMIYHHLPSFTTTWNAKCPICLGNFTTKTSNYCLKNRALGFPGTYN